MLFQACDKCNRYYDNTFGPCPACNSEHPLDDLVCHEVEVIVSSEAGAPFTLICKCGNVFKIPAETMSIIAEKAKDAPVSSA